MSIIKYILILVSLTLITFVDAKSNSTFFLIYLEKAKAKPAQSDLPEKSSPKRPTGTSPELYCNACQAVVREMVKRLKHRNSESDVTP